MRLQFYIIGILCLLISGFTFAENASQIPSGNYSLNIRIPNIGADEPEKLIKGHLQVSGNQISFDTFDAMDTPVTFSGEIQDKAILLWLTGEERGGIVTFHLAGTLTGIGNATGKVTVFHTHDIVGNGTWNLRIDDENTEPSVPGHPPQAAPPPAP